MLLAFYSKPDSDEAVANLPLLALFEDYKAFGMDFGFRQYFGTATARPYVGAGGGFVRVDEIQSEFSVPAAGVVLSNVNMYDTSVVPSIGAGGGVQINLSDRFAVQGGVEFKWQGDAKDLDGLAGRVRPRADRRVRRGRCGLYRTSFDWNLGAVARLRQRCRSMRGTRARAA